MPTDATAAPRGLDPRRTVGVHHLLDLQIDFAPVPTFATPVGTRMLFAAVEGRFDGPGLAGTVLPGTADWLSIGSDGIGRIDVRAVLRTGDGAHIFMSNTGRAVLGEHSARFLAGERVTSEQAYLRTHPLFDTTAPDYAHLNGMATVAFCDISLADVRYRIYAVD